MPTNRMRPIHPGEILREEYLAPLGMSANAFAKVLHVPTNRVTGILNQKRSVSADTALRLARALGTTPQFWLNLQQIYELRVAEGSSGAALRAVRPIRRTTAA
jgi:addiction module HigA family antidote